MASRKRHHKKTHSLICIFLCASIVLMLSGCAKTRLYENEAINTTSAYAEPVSLTQVTIDDDFWSPRQKQLICTVLPTAINKVEEETGGIPNIVNAAMLHRGEGHGDFAGEFYVDSDVHKVIEAMSYALMITPSPDDKDTHAAQEFIKEKLEEWIPYYVDAQEQDGYFDTYFTLSSSNDAKASRFSDFNLHELYCAGHLYEAAIAHFEACERKDYRLLNVAIKNADHISALFGERRWKQVPGHPEIELALFKLSKLCDEIGGEYAQRASTYRDLAKFFLDSRGDHSWRHGTSAPSEKTQDTIPVRETRTATGHAVRAMYLYSGIADAAMSFNTDEYDQALISLWNDVTNTKTYITGGIGSVASCEGFGEPFDLPNDTAYNETCASIGSVFWNERMGRLFGESKYADEMERALYNGVLSCVSLTGESFFYQNPMQSAGGKGRSEWFDTACCPSNYARLIASLGSYIYTQQGDTITLNLYIGNSLNTVIENRNFSLKVNSSVPWNGFASIIYTGDEDVKSALRLRIPSWSKGQAIISINDAPLSFQTGEDGYATIDQVWYPGDRIDINFKADISREYSDSRVAANKGLVALRKGPIIYAAESADNHAPLFQYVLPKDAKITEKRGVLSVKNSSDIDKNSTSFDQETTNNNLTATEKSDICAQQCKWLSCDSSDAITIKNTDEGPILACKRSPKTVAIHEGQDLARFSNYTIQAKLTLTGYLSSYSGVVLLADHSSFQSRANGFDGWFIGIGKYADFRGIIIGKHSPDKGWEHLELVPTASPIQVNHQYALDVVLNNSMLEVYLDGALLASVNSLDTQPNNNAIGFCSYQQSCTLDSFSITTMQKSDTSILDYSLSTQKHQSKDVLSDIIMLHASAKALNPERGVYEPCELTFIPYYAWQNRGFGEMLVYLHEDENIAPYDNLARLATARASDQSLPSHINALNDGTALPWFSSSTSSSCWVELEFSQRTSIEQCQINWLEGFGARLPKAIEIEFWDSLRQQYISVTPLEQPDVYIAGRANTYAFAPINTTRLRIKIRKENPGETIGISEWKVTGEMLQLP